jgi:hypothetical protein
MAYREGVLDREEALLTLDVYTSKGGTTVGLLMAMSIVFLVMLGVSVFAGAPPEIEPYIWTFGVGAVAFAIPSVIVWIKRKRVMRVVRDRRGVRLVVPGETELTFPLTATGSQYTEHMRGVPIYHVFLKLVDGDGRGIVFKETRGAIHGPQRQWFEKVDQTARATSYDVSSAGDAARIRDFVADTNRDVRESVT